MTQLLFVLPNVEPGDSVRVDTASGSNTPATVYAARGGAVVGPTFHADPSGRLPHVYGADGVTTLYLKHLNYKGTVTGSPVTVTGVDDSVSAGGASGSAASSGAGQAGNGFAMPKGWGAKLKAAVAAAATTRSEWVVFGDSTTFGAGPTPNYSWLQRLRDRMATDGVVLGGKGVFGASEGSVGYDTPEVNGFVSKTGWTWGQDASYQDILFGESFTSNVANDVLTVQGYGNEFRVWLTNREGTEVGIAIDGGAEVIYNPTGTPDSTPRLYRVAGLSGSQASPVLHTAVLRNLGGAAILAPTLSFTSPSASGGTMAAGTYYYVATTYNAATGAESVISVEKSAVVPAGGTGSVPMTLGKADIRTGPTTRVYRGTASGGPYGLVGTVATNGNGTYNFTDTGTAAGAAPVQNGGLNGTTGRAYAAPAFMYSTGIVVQKYARTGGTMVQNFDPLGLFNGQPSGRAQYPGAALGLDAASINTHIGGNGGVAPTASFPWGSAVSAAAGAPTPSLAVLYLGFNDMTSLATPWGSSVTYTTGAAVTYGGGTWIAQAGSTNVQPGTDVTKWKQGTPAMTLDAFEAGVYEFCQLARAAGADVLVIAPEYIVNAVSWATAGAIVGRMRSTALALGAAWADFSIPLGPPNNMPTVQSVGNPHLAKAGYVAQADFLYDNVIKPAIAGQV